MTTGIATGLKTILVHHLGVDEGWITESARLIEDLRADSLDVVEIAMTIEEAFNIRIPDWVADSFVTVGDINAYLAAEDGQCTGGPRKMRMSVGCWK